MAWSKQQTTTNNSAATAVTSLTLNFSATQPGSLLYLIAVSGINSVLTVSGWTTVRSGNIAGGGTYIIGRYENNPGGLTSAVVNSSATALLCGVMAEYVGANSPNGQTLDIEGINNTGTATAQSPVLAAKCQGDLALVAVIYTNNTALTFSGIQSGFTQDATAVCTNASANPGCGLFSGIGLALASFSFTATLSGSPIGGAITDLALYLPFVIQTTNGNIGPYNNYI